MTTSSKLTQKQVEDILKDFVTILAFYEVVSLEEEYKMSVDDPRMARWKQTAESLWNAVKETLAMDTVIEFKTFNIYDKSEPLLHAFPVARGVILPSGQVALEWEGDNRTFNLYPNIEGLMAIQNKQPNREVVFGGFAPDGFHLTTFRLVRAEDVTGVSGTGVVAYGCNLGIGAVLQWNGEVPSIAYYPEGCNQIDKLHGHGGKTVIEQDITPSW